MLDPEFIENKFPDFNFTFKEDESTESIIYAPSSEVEFFIYNISFFFIPDSLGIKSEFVMFSVLEPFIIDKFPVEILVPKEYSDLPNKE